MKFPTRHITVRFLLDCTVLLLAGISAVAAEGQSTDRASNVETIDRHGDSLIEVLDGKVRSAQGLASPIPIVFYGEGRIKVQYHNFGYDPVFLRANRSWLQSGWEANEGLLRLGIMTNPGRNVALFAKIGFQHTLPGNTTERNDPDYPGFTPLKNRHDKSDEPAYIHEDLLAGITLRTGPVSCKLKLGGLQWIEASPLTIWKYQQRMFAWDYLPYEIEEPITTYYVKNIIEGERTGRAAWNRRPFNGIGIDSMLLPYGFLMNLFYGSFEAFDKHEREYVELQGDLAYYSEYATEAKGRGIGDSYRHVLYGRIEKCRALGKLTPGINVVAVGYDDDIAGNETFKNAFGISGGSGEAAFYKEPLVGSFDLRGKLTDGVTLHADVAGSRVDTTFLSYSTGGGGNRATHRSSGLRGAAYAGLESELPVPLRLELFCATPGFCSPFSFARSIDAFYPVGANLAGPGEFVASAYSQNMAGFSCTVSPLRIDHNGHFRIAYGNYRQIKPGPDIIFFPYRLNGADMYTLFQTSYSRWGLNLVDTLYGSRMGDESWRRNVYLNPAGPEAGGLRSHYMAMYEGFVPYVSADGAMRNLTDTAQVDMFTRGYVPRRVKYTCNMSVDAAYDVSALTGWSRSVLFGVYGALHGISSSLRLVVVDKNSEATMLWGALVRVESAIALHERLYLLGSAGFENWYAGNAWMDRGGKSLPVRTPIDYRDIAFGVGADWQMLDRVSVHVRCKKMGHRDVY